MKTFWIALAIFLLAVLAVAANALYINNVATRLESMLSDLPEISSPTCVPSATDLRDYWQKHKNWVDLSARFSIADRVSEQIETLLACASCGDLYGFQTARVLLIDALDDLTRTESLRAAL